MLRRPDGTLTQPVAASADGNGVVDQAMPKPGIWTVFTDALPVRGTYQLVLRSRNEIDLGGDSWTEVTIPVLLG